MNRKDQIRMKRYLPFVIIAAVLVAAVGAGYLMFNSAQTQPSTTLPPAASSGVTPGAAVSKGAAVVIDEFGDYQCPPCGSLHPLLKTLKSEYGDRLQINFHHFPLVAIHSHALEAAYAASAASLQGKFWEMHNLLYENQSTWSQVGDFNPLLLDYARRAGLDVARFTRDMNGLQVMKIVSEDGRRAEAAGVNSTPTIFINNQLVLNEKLTPEGLRKEINQRLPVNP
jgi:protein-disulfide isomerase